MNQVLAHVEKYAEELASLGPENEKLGKLSDRTVEIMREVGVIRMLQAKDRGGMEADLRDFAEVVMRLASLDTSRPVPFHVDRPFVVLVRHARTGAIYFLAHVSDPA